MDVKIEDRKDLYSARSVIICFTPEKLSKLSPKEDEADNRTSEYGISFGACLTYDARYMLIDRTYKGGGIVFC